VELGRINAILVNPQDNGKVFAGAREGFVIALTYKSDRVLNDYYSMPRNYQVAVPVSRAMAGGPPGVQYLEALAMNPTRPKVLFAAFAGIFRSENGGENWKQVYNMPTVYSLLVDSKNPSQIYAGTDFSIIRSTDGGDNWKPIREGVFFLTLAQSSDGTIFAGGGDLSVSKDGVNWNRLINKVVLSIAFHPTDARTIYFGSTDSSVWKTTDGGKSWAQVFRGMPEDSGQRVIAAKTPLIIDPANPSTLYVGTMGRGVYKTIDGGSNWRELNDGLGDKNVFSLALSDSATLFAGTASGDIYRIVQTK
jgi:hypothetical protein